ncbi:MAG: hypothetical protein AB1758_36925, partial [Candidatus Eremiobacterota bacterium]
MRGFRTLFISILLLAVGAEAAADQLFVRNKPFKGVVVGNGDQMYVELEALTRAVDMQIVVFNGASVIGTPPDQVEPGTVVVNKEVVPSRPGPQAGQVLVSLKDFARVTRCKLNVNPALKTVDLYLPSSSAG